MLHLFQRSLLLSTPAARSGTSHISYRLLACSSSLRNLGPRQIHVTSANRDRSFTNLLADEFPPAVQVASISDNGIRLADGLILNGPSIFLDGKVFLWDVPSLDTSSKIGEERWKNWNAEYFELFKVVTPRPEILLLGTGKTILQPPPFVREFLRKLGIQLDVMDTRNACSAYNLLTEEGRRVGAALLPLSSHPWQKTHRVRP